MICVAWNARGLGNPRAIRNLRHLIAKSSPTLLFISETKLFTYQCRKWATLLNFKGCFSVDCDQRSGGLMIMWRESIEVCIQSFSSGHIDCIVKKNLREWRFTGFYGNPVVGLRGFSWQLLRRLGGIHELKNLPWLVGEISMKSFMNRKKVVGSASRVSNVSFLRSVR